MQLRNQMSSLLNSAFQLLSGVAVVLLALVVFDVAVFVVVELVVVE